LDCASPSHSPPPPGLARGWREGGRTAGHGRRFTAALTSAPGPGPWVWIAGLGLRFSAALTAVLARGWWEGAGLLDWTAPLCHPHRRPRAWPVGGGRGVDCWTWTTILRHPHRRPRGSFSTETAPSWPLRLAGASFPTN
jgi:hypothetical protein